MINSNSSDFTPKPFVNGLIQGDTYKELCIEARANLIIICGSEYSNKTWDSLTTGQQKRIIEDMLYWDRQSWYTIAAYKVGRIIDKAKDFCY